MTAGGTQIWERGALDTSADPFPSGGTNTTVTGVDATTVTTSFLGTLITTVNIEDGDFFQIDRDGNGTGDVGFEFDTGPEFLINVNVQSANPQVPQDGDTFTVDGFAFQFDTGSVIVVTAQNGGQITDGTTLTISDNAATPSTVTFEFDNNTQHRRQRADHVQSDQQSAAIVNAIITSVARVPNFGVQAVQLQGTFRLTLIGESPTAGATTNATGITILGQPGVAGTAVAVRWRKRTSLRPKSATAIATAVNATPGLVFQAGAAGNRAEFCERAHGGFHGRPQSADLHRRTGWPAPSIASACRSPSWLTIRVWKSPTASTGGRRFGDQRDATGHHRVLDAVPPPAAQPEYVCLSYGTPPQIGAVGIPDCPLQSGGSAPGGSIRGMAFVGRQLYAVTDTGGLFRIASGGGGCVQRRLSPSTSRTTLMVRRASCKRSTT